jgi:hypothetical protein
LDGNARVAIKHQAQVGEVPYSCARFVGDDSTKTWIAETTAGRQHILVVHVGAVAVSGKVEGSIDAQTLRRYQLRAASFAALAGNCQKHL